MSGRLVPEEEQASNVTADFAMFCFNTYRWCAGGVPLPCAQACLLPLKPLVFKLSVEHPGAWGDKGKVVLMASAVGSSVLSNGAPVPGQGMFLAVPQELMAGENLAISVRIDQAYPVDDAAATAAKTMPAPPPLHARTTRRFH